jgi:hypothetical protein
MTKSNKLINPFIDFGLKKLFQVAALANLFKEEHQDYINNLKYYRDMKNVNVTDTAFQEGAMKGKMEEPLKSIQKSIRRGKLTDVEITAD